MKPGQPSSTAEAAAAQRVLHLILDNTPLVFEDREVIRLLSPALGRYLETLQRLRLPPALLAPYNSSAARQIRGQIVTRSRFAEDAMHVAFERGVRQVVVLGAGLESLLLRQTGWPSGTRLIEIDHPATQARKQAALGDRIPENVSFLGIDFEEDDLAARLTNDPSGPQLDEPVFCIWLGVSYYLSIDALRSTLSILQRSLAPGSEVVLDYWQPSGDRSRPSSSILQGGLRLSLARTEPLRTFLTEEGAAKLAEQAQMNIIADLSATAIRRRYLKYRRDRLDVPDFARLLHLQLAS